MKLNPMRLPFFTKTESDSINQKIFRAALIIGLLTGGLKAWPPVLLAEAVFFFSAS